jgi:LysM repeat protein
MALLAASSAFLLLVVLFSGQLSADAGTSAGQQGRATNVVVVQSGETLWQIAHEVAPGADPRAVITLIRSLNGLGNSAIVAGQSIVVPVTG